MTNPLQAVVDAMSHDWARKRAETQFTLGKLIAALQGLDQERLIQPLGDPHSYRGYYSDLAFDPATVDAKAGATTVGFLLGALKDNCMGRTFEGYKGGDFAMTENTPLWIAEYGRSGAPRVMGLDVGQDPIAFVLAREDD